MKQFENVFLNVMNLASNTKEVESNTGNTIPRQLDTADGIFEFLFVWYKYVIFSAIN